MDRISGLLIMRSHRDLAVSLLPSPVDQPHTSHRVTSLFVSAKSVTWSVLVWKQPFWAWAREVETVGPLVLNL